MAVLVRSKVDRRARAGSRLAAALALVALVSPLAVHAQDWLISIIEGDAVVIDGVRRYAATAGQRLDAGAIVETAAKTGLVRLEGSDQSTHDLGPDTRVMLAPAGFPFRNERPPQIYLMQGWLKSTARGARDAAGIVTPAIEVLPFKGSVVVQQQKREHMAFVEGGRIDVVERRVGSGTIAVDTGQFYGAEGARRGSVAARPAPAWLQTVPKSFRDPIPLRAQAWRDKRVDAGLLPGPTYAHLADWLTAEMTLRVHMPGRFGPLARDMAFRNEISSHMSAHPEWGPLIAELNRPRRAASGASR